jgi:HTH-type transcriptional regulator / antitoxin HigA
MIEPVTDKASHRKALRRIEELWDAGSGSREERELDALATLVDAYEKRSSPIEPLGPIEAIEARCEYLGWGRRELEPLIGSRARVSEVLSGRRPLSLAMIRRLHDALDIPAEVLIAEIDVSEGAPKKVRPSSGPQVAKTAMSDRTASRGTSKRIAIGKQVRVRSSARG